MMGLKLKDMSVVFFVTACLVFLAHDALAAQLKKTIAVSRFENKADAAVGTGMADQLTDALVQSGKFVVLERTTLEDVVAEQDIAASGRASVSESAKTGKLVPSQILIKGTVTEFETETKKGGTGLSVGGVSFGSSRTSAHVAVVLRIIDTTSGEVLDSKRVEGKATAKGTKVGLDIGDFDLGSEDFKKTPLGEAAQIAIDKAVKAIAKKLDDIPFEGRIIKVDGDTLYTNIGRRNGVEAGTILNVYKLSEEIVDPVTGESLGAERTEAGTIKITSVEAKFSKGVAESGEIFEQGMVVTE